ncbi:MAG: hypothetical protein IKL27_09475 [Oscillospiraceae bacterium]|nr:hypothetical protein [Oscillospiraceae bacterium]
MKIVGAAFFVAVVVYFAIYVFSSLDTPYQTISAVEYTVRDSVGLEGIVVRDEEPLLTYYNSLHIAVENGKRVPAGGTVGIVYSSDSELQRAERIREINMEIQSLEELQESGISESQKLENGIKSEIQSLRSAVQNRQLDNIGALSSNVRTLVLSAAGDETSIDVELAVLYEERKNLQSVKSNPYDVIKAIQSGLFSTVADGFEDISPDDLEEMDPEALTNLMEGNRSRPELALGKLVYGSKWYFASVMEENEANDFNIGERVTMIFGKYYSEYLDMRVESIGIEDDNGNCVVIFSCSEAMVDVLDMRMQSAELIVHEDTGVRVPKKAIRVDEEGRVYVYTQTGMQAEKKIVEIMHDLGEHYVVASEKLRPGDIVIVSGRDIYDGKVVR